MSSLDSTQSQRTVHKRYYSYFKRLIRIQHLEFDNAIQQILWVLVSPKKV